MSLKIKNTYTSKIIFILIFLILASSKIYSQEIFSSDTLVTSEATAPADTTAIISPDTIRTTSGVDTVINYSSNDSIIYSIKNRKMMLYGNGNIKYRLMELKSERVDINWDTAILEAMGVADSSDTSGVKFTGNPIMTDAGEEFHGHKLLYNFKTQKGNITLADTKADEGKYYGKKVKKIDKNVLFIADGKYTTCDLEEPHFYFLSPRMKLIVRDKVIAEPIYFYIADVPVFALPFGVFPSKGGRRSGFFAPAYGEDATRGRFLKRLGYYWAMSEYTDIALQGDWYTNGSYLINSDFNYALRYNFTGGINGTYKRFITNEKGDPNYIVEEGYNVNIRHHQEINPSMRADVNFSFMSNNNFRLTNNLNEALQQTIYSNATLSKFWEGTPNSATINISRSQNLTDGRIDEVLPTISFNRSQSYPFRRKDAVGELDWYEQIGYNYNANFSHSRSKIPVTISNVKVESGVSENVFGNAEDFRRDTRLALNQGTSISISPKFGYFTVTPNFSFRDERSQINNLIPQRNVDDSTLIKVREKDHFASGFLSSGISTNTRLYGILQPNLLGVTALRHTLSPNLGLNYSKQIYGKNLGRKQMRASLDIGNLFEMKLKPITEGQEERKIQLLNVGAGLSYDFAADSLNFSNIGVSYRTAIGELLNFSGFTSFNLYKFDRTANRVVNKFLISEEGKLARLETFSISLSTSLSGERKPKSKDAVAADTILETESGYYGLYQREEPDFNLPWRLSFSWNFSENFVPNARYRNANISASLDFNLTEKWKFRISGNYDIIRKEISAPSVQIDRDLHCWVMNFSWVPIGTYKHYRLEIRVKASQLQDVKITKQRTTY